MAGPHRYPRSKPFVPPPAGAPANPKAVSAQPISTSPKTSRRRWKWLLLILLLGAGALGAAIFKIGLPAHADHDDACQRLCDLQHEWWKQEGTVPGTNPVTALEKLIDRQREWWESEDLAIDGNPDGSEPLERLENRQREWWEREGLAKGQAAKDPAAALAHLERLSRLWWQEEKPTRLPPVPPEETASSHTEAGGDTEVKLIDKDNTRAFLQAGGTEESEQAVQLGLKWLATQQMPDGRWRRNGKPSRPRPDKVRPDGLDTASTAFALLPFLAQGQTQRAVEGRTAYAKVVEEGLNYLLLQQKPNGDISGGRTMYIHALAAIALCEAYDASSDPLLKSPCQKAIDFIVEAQGPQTGGWRYAPGAEDGDLSVTSWCLMALKSGQMGGLHVPTKTLDKANGFLQKMARGDGGYDYQTGIPGFSPPTPAVMTAAGIVCRQYLLRDEDLRSPNLTRGSDIILANPPQEAVRNFYFYYYAAYALIPIGGDTWKKWNPKARDLLVSWQDKGEATARWKGSWNPQGAYHLQESGRVGVTSLALLTLEVYYRHLPLNRPELGEMTKPSAAK